MRGIDLGLTPLGCVISNAFLHPSHVYHQLALLEQRRMRIAELEKEIETLMSEKKERVERGKPVDDLETRIEELERRKHELVEQLQDVWSS